LPIWQLYERARSLGLAVQVSAQSWQGLAGDDDERYRIAAAADGGIWLLRTPHPEPVTGLAGTRRLTDTTRRLLGVPVWAHQGTSRIRQAPVVDPALIRALDVGQTAYIYRGGVTFIQVKRLVGAPAALTGPAWVAVASGQLPGRFAQPPEDGQADLGPAERGAAERGPAERRPADPELPDSLQPARAGPASPPTTGPAARPPPGMAPASPAPGRPLPDVSELLEAFGAEASP